MNEPQAIYRVADLVDVAEADRDDTALRRIAIRTATHYTTLMASGVDIDTVRELTGSFQDYLLCVAEEEL